MNKLKPCPFCGKSAHVEKHVTAIGNESFQVQHLCKSLLSDLKTFCYPSEAEAIATWNRRPDRWIPVVEYLPGNYEKILFTRMGGAVVFSGMYYQHKFYSEDYLVTDITHWMPLPEPPGRGEK